MVAKNNRFEPRRLLTVDLSHYLWGAFCMNSLVADGKRSKQ